MARHKTTRSYNRRGSKPAGSSFFAEFGRLISWHRRKLAVVCAMAATTAGITAVSPPDPSTASVVVARHQLDGGATVKSGDVTVRQVATNALPHGAITGTKAVVGRTLVGPIANGAMLTRLNVLGKSTITKSGKVIAPLRVADSAVVNLLRVGDRVDVLASDPESNKSATVVAKRARVVTIPESEDSGAQIGVAPHGNDKKPSLLLVEVSSSEANTLADAGSSSQLSVLLG